MSEKPKSPPVGYDDTPFLPGGKWRVHDGKRPQALALFEGERLTVLYTYETDLGDGWEDPQVHGDPPEKHR